MEENKKEEMSEKEKRIRNITKFYYSKPEILDALVKFSSNREVVPRYFEGFGKRPDSITYPSDIIGLVQRGATSFHGSEEIWHDPLKINSEMSQEEMSTLRKSWDLLIDIDSPFFDYSKIMAKLVIKFIESYGIKNYGIKYSGSKGFHIIVSGKAFPNEYDGKIMKESFPEWPRAICQFIIEKIRPAFNREVGVGDVEALSKKEDLSKDEITEVLCPRCGKVAAVVSLVKLKCNECGDYIERRNYKTKNRELRCVRTGCPGMFEVEENKEGLYFCDNCKIYSKSSLKDIKDTLDVSARGEVIMSGEVKMTGEMDFIFEKGIKDEHKGSADLVLVSPRHLFRMPYSLHEKTSLVSIVLTKEELVDFNPSLASPMKAKVRDFYPKNEDNEAKRLLSESLEWKKNKDNEEERKTQEHYKNYKVLKTGERGKKEHEEFNFEGVEEKMFPMPIKKLLKGLKDGRKRGLFVLITFFRSMNMTPEYINNKVREWNKLNGEPLKEGYIKSQIDWHLKQRKKILPPNYENEAFYKDLGVLDKRPDAKNPLVEVMRTMRKARG